MKRILVLLLSILCLASLFISCSNEASSDRLARVSFANANRRSLIQSIDNIADEDLEWHYSAAKKSLTEFNTGATDDSTLASINSSFELSQGKWDFTLWAIRKGDANKIKVYMGSVEDVMILASKDNNDIYVEVTPYIEGAPGSIVISKDIAIKKSDGTSLFVKPNILKVDDTIYSTYNSEVDFTISNLAAGSHDIVLAYVTTDDGEEVTSAAEKKTVTVESGRTTTISGYISEATGSVSFDKHNAAVAGDATANITDSDMTLSVAVTPSMVTGNSTSVLFPAGTLTGSTATLTVIATPAGGNFSIESTESTTSIASLDLKLSIDGVEKSEFTSAVTVTTYIAKGLDTSKLSIKYSGSGLADGTLVSYETTTGKLVFTTTHFSSFVASMSSNYYAYNKDTNTAYATIQSAVSAVSDNNTVVVLKECALDSTDLITAENKKFTLDFNDKQVSGTNILKVTGSSSDVTLINGNINEVDDTAIEITDSAKVTIKNGSYRTSLDLIKVSNNAKLNIIDGTFNAYGPAKGYVLQSLTGSTTTIENGSFRSTLNKCITIGLYEDSTDTLGGSVTINGGTFTSAKATILSHADAKLTINDGTFTSEDTADGGAVIATNEGSSLVSKTNPYSIEINGGTFKADVTTADKVACGIYLANSGDVYLNAGTFNIHNGIGVLVRRGTLYTQYYSDKKKDLKFNIAEDNSDTAGVKGYIGGITSNSGWIWVKSTSEIVVDPNAGIPGLYPVACRFNGSELTVKSRNGAELIPYYRDSSTEYSSYENSHGYINDTDGSFVSKDD